MTEYKNYVVLVEHERHDDRPDRWDLPAEWAAECKVTENGELVIVDEGNFTYVYNANAWWAVQISPDLTPDD